MCGLFGFINLKNISYDQCLSDLKKGMESIRHRGPDENGYWVSDDKKIGLGHLKIDS